MTLVIFKVNQLGDNVVFLPVVQSLKACLAGWRIVVMTSPVAARLYEVACPGVELMPFETRLFNGAWRRPWFMAELGWKIRALAPDACLIGDDQGSVAHFLAGMSGAEVKVGPLTDRVRLNAMAGVRVPWIEGEHVAMHNWRMACRLVEALHLKAPCLPGQIPVPDLTAFGLEKSGAVLIHAGASRPYKRWPLNRFVELANRLARTHRVIWMNQKDRGEAELDGGVERVDVGILDDFIRRLAGACYFVGNNSGPMNLASALGVPGTILNGPSTPNWDPPWHGDRFDVLRDPDLSCQPCDQLSHPVNACQNTAEPMTCMDRWSVDRVHARVMARLAGVDHPPM